MNDQILSGHPEQQKNFNLLARNYYWLKIKETVYQYIQNYNICRQAKGPRNQYNGLVNPLPIHTRPWANVSLYFVTGLPQSNDYNAILIVID